MNTSRLLTGAVICMLALWPRLAPGADRSDGGEVSRRAAARALFDEGTSLMAAERWEAAAERLERARKLQPSARIDYNLTTALLRLGRLVQASDLLAGIRADPSVDADVRRAAETRLAEITPKLGRLTVVVDGNVEGAVLVLDGRPLDPSMWNVAIPVDPGAHEVALARDERTLLGRRVQVGEGQRVRVALEVHEDEVARRAPGPEPVVVPADASPLITAAEASPAETTGARDDSSRLTWWWVGGGAVVVGVVMFLLIPRPAPEVVGNPMETLILHEDG
jgi:hypothetical protein